MTDHLHPDHSCTVCQPMKPANRPMFGPLFGRRTFFQAAAAGLSGFFLAPLAKDVEAMTLHTTAAGEAKLKGTARNAIFILLNGAPSHADTFDLKVGAWTPADFNPTTQRGILFPQGLLPHLFNRLEQISIVRNLRSPALVHGLQQVWAQIARNPTSQMGRVAPNIGAVVALEAERERQPNQKLPGFIAINAGGIVGAGYFNPRFAPFEMNAAATGLGNLTNADGATFFNTRFQMLQELDGDLRAGSRGYDVKAMDDFYQQSRALMYNAEIDAIFRFAAADQQRYGNTGFGNSCIVARNLLKANQGTRYIQLSLGGWDNHQNIYGAAGARNGALYGPTRTLDNGLSNLLTDLEATPGVRGGSLLDETLVVAMGEFGRTVGPLNNGGGRDHFFQQFCMFAGGGIMGGRTIGLTDSIARNVIEPQWSQGRPSAAEDIAATIYSALGIDYTTTRRDDPFQRGFDYVPFASEGAWYPVLELFSRDIQTRDPQQRGTVDRPIGG
jgi:hypothetical protein